MAYVVNKSNGDILTTLIDGQVDTITTDLALIGKNYTGYGEQINENFVKLLENFSGNAEPDKPIVGQLWYDTTLGRLMVFNENRTWKAAGGPIVQNQSPLNFTTGDIWIDNNENQMYFYDGTDLLLAGPIWKRTQGKTGFVAETLVDRNNNPKPVLYLYVRDSLLGIFSTEEFQTNPVLNGFPVIKKGFTANANINFSFDTTVSNSLALNSLSSSQFMRSDASTVNSTKILIQNNNGLTIGSNQIADFKINGTTAIIENVVNGGDITLKTNTSAGRFDALYIDSSTSRIGIFTPSPQQTMDINGTLRVRGDFIVEGDTVNVNVSNLTVEDKTIELNINSDSSSNSTDASANGAGIIIKASSDKTILYNNTTGYKSFDISENINLAAGKVFRIGGIEILSSNTLSAAITTAPGITSIGPQISLTVDDLYLNDNRISNTVNNQDIEIAPAGTGNLALIGSPRITGLSDPVDDQDASTKFYAETFSKLHPISLTLIENGLTGAINTNCILLLNDIANPVFFAPGKYAFIHIQNVDNSVVPAVVTRTLKLFTINNTGSGNFWEFTSDLTSSI